MIKAIDFDEFLVALDLVLGDLFGKKPTPELQLLWWSSLKDFPLTKVKDALNLWATRSKFAPKPADIRRLCDPQGAEEPQASAAAVQCSFEHAGVRCPLVATVFVGGSGYCLGHYGKQDLAAKVAHLHAAIERRLPPAYRASDLMIARRMLVDFDIERVRVVYGDELLAHLLSNPEAGVPPAAPERPVIEGLSAEAQALAARLPVAGVGPSVHLRGLGLHASPELPEPPERELPPIEAYEEYGANAGGHGASGSAGAEEPF